MSRRYFPFRVDLTSNENGWTEHYKFSPSRVLARYRNLQELRVENEIVARENRLRTANRKLRKYVERQVSALRFPIIVTEEMRRRFGYDVVDAEKSFEYLENVVREWNLIESNENGVFVCIRQGVGDRVFKLTVTDSH